MTYVKKRAKILCCGLREVVYGRSLWCCMLALSLAVIMITVSQQIKTVYVRDRGNVHLTYTLRQNPDTILEDMGIATKTFDEVHFSGFDGGMGIINITRAFPVTVSVDGRFISMMATDETVEDILKKANVELGEFDEINYSLGSYVKPDDSIEIKRVELTTTVVYETIPHEIEYKENSLLRKGRTRTLSAGKDGERALTYIDRMVDGVLEDRKLSSSVVTKEPVTQLVLRGNGGAVSDFDFGIELDANGAPKNYKKVLTNQICTGYSARRGAKGASRMVLQDGCVAVRSDEIPYGTKMYITSADNSFVYGCAVAADTGVGLMQDVIDFDLYYETYIESCLNGRKYLNVYIL